MQRPAEMPASVSGQLLTGIELTLVLTPPEESEGHKVRKKMNSLCLPESGTLVPQPSKLQAFSVGRRGRALL